MDRIHEYSRMSVETVVRRLRRIEPFVHLSERELADLVISLNPTVLVARRKQLLVRAGDPIDRILILAKGVVHGLLSDASGEDRVMGALESGFCIGASSVVTNEAVHGLSWRTYRICTLVSFDVTAVRRYVASHPESSVRPYLERQVSAYVFELIRKASLTGGRRISDRVLTYLSQRSEAECSATVEIPFDRDSFASYLGGNRAAVSAVLSRLRAKGVLDFRKSRFTLLDTGRVHTRGAF